jgi:hypothetical protein
MKREEPAKSQHVTNGGVLERGHFSVAAEAAEHIMEVLSKLSPNPVRYVEQEYITNARDSMIASGKSPKDTTIVLPTSSSLIFKVRDYGTSMTHDVVVNTFLKYGATTKEGDDNQLGHFGIGAKAGFAYTDTFTVVCFLDGERRAYIAHRGDGFSFDLIDQSKTDEPNGVEIQIPVQAADLNKFYRNVLQTTYFWPERPQIQGIDLPKRFLAKPTVTIGNVSLFNNATDHGSGFYEPNISEWGVPRGLWFVIGGIPYKYNNDMEVQDAAFLNELNPGSYGDNGMWACYISVAATDLQVAFNREAIKDSKPNKERLAAIARDARATVEAHIKKTFAGCKSVHETADAYRLLKDVVKLPGQDVIEDGITFKVTVYGKKVRVAFDGIDSLNIHQYRMGQSRRGNSGLKLQTATIATMNSPMELSQLMYYIDADTTKIRERVLQQMQNNADKTGVPMLQQTLVLIHTPTLGVPNTELRDKVIKMFGFLPTSTLPEPNFKITDSGTVIKTERKARVKKPQGVITVAYVRSKERGWGKTTSLKQIDTNTMKFVYQVRKNEYSEDELNQISMVANVITESKMGLVLIADTTLSKIEDDDNFIPYKDYINDTRSYMKDYDGYLKKILRSKLSDKLPLETIKVLKTLEGSVASQEIINLVNTMVGNVPFCDAKEINDVIEKQNTKHIKDTIDLADKLLTKAPLIKYIRLPDTTAAKELVAYINEKME